VCGPALFETEWEPDRHEPSSNQEYSEFGLGRISDSIWPASGL
jgi:hypothetical protein